MVALNRVYDDTWAATRGGGLAIVALYFIASFVAKVLLIVLLLEL